MTTNAPRIGFGFDSHLFAGEGTLRLGGVSFEGVPRLKGHSDGDALLHAVVDALLGAAGLGDIGDHFPDSDPQWEGASSETFVRHASGLVAARGWTVSNVDVTVLADRPKLGPAKTAIRDALAQFLSISSDRANVKAKTAEGLTLFHEPGGIAVWAAVSLHSMDHGS